MYIYIFTHTLFVIAQCTYIHIYILLNIYIYMYYVYVYITYISNETCDCCVLVKPGHSEGGVSAHAALGMAGPFAVSA